MAKNNPISKSAFEPEFSFQIAVIGDYGVGKTALLNHEIEKYQVQNLDTGSGIRFRPKIYEEEWGLGLAHQTKLELLGVNKAESQRKLSSKTDTVQRTIKVTYLDPTGKEKYFKQTCRICGQCAGVIYVFDVNNRLTLDDLELWMNEMEKYIPKNHPKMVIGNKVDSGTSEIGDGVSISNVRQVNIQEANAFVQRFKNCYYYETSAIHGTGVEEAFRCIREEVLKEVVTYSSTDLKDKIRDLEAQGITVGKTLLPEINAFALPKHTLSTDMGYNHAKTDLLPVERSKTVPETSMLAAKVAPMPPMKPRKKLPKTASLYPNWLKT